MTDRYRLTDWLVLLVLLVGWLAFGLYDGNGNRWINSEWKGAEIIVASSLGTSVSHLIESRLVKPFYVDTTSSQQCAGTHLMHCID
jgi:hypothetical protein